MPYDKNQQELTLIEKYRFAQAVALWPALAILVFSRTRLGFRIVKPTWLIADCLALFVASAFVPSGDGMMLRLYGLAILVAGLVHRRLRWLDLVKGVNWHSYSTGVSHFERAPLPVFFRLCARAQRFLEPLTAYAVGITVFLLVSHALGGAIMLAGIGLAVFEQSVYERRMDRDLDLLDSLVASDVQKELLEVYPHGASSGAIRETTPPALEETAGIPVGVAADLVQAIERKRRRAAAADKLAGIATDGAVA